MKIQTGSETNPFDQEAFDELNHERFAGSLSATLCDNGCAVITTPSDMSDDDLTAVVHLIDIDAPIIH